MGASVMMMRVYITVNNRMSEVVPLFDSRVSFAFALETNLHHVFDIRPFHPLWVARPYFLWCWYAPTDVHILE